MRALHESAMDNARLGKGRLSVILISLRQNESVIRCDAQAVTLACMEERRFLVRSYEVAHIKLTSRLTHEMLGPHSMGASAREICSFVHRPCLTTHFLKKETSTK